MSSLSSAIDNCLYESSTVGCSVGVNCSLRSGLLPRVKTNYYPPYVNCVQKLCVQNNDIPIIDHRLLIELVADLFCFNSLRDPACAQLDDVILYTKLTFYSSNQLMVVGLITSQ